MFLPNMDCVRFSPNVRFSVIISTPSTHSPHLQHFCLLQLLQIEANQIFHKFPLLLANVLYCDYSFSKLNRALKIGLKHGCLWEAFFNFEFGCLFNVVVYAVNLMHQLCLFAFFVFIQLDLSRVSYVTSLARCP